VEQKRWHPMRTPPLVCSTAFLFEVEGFIQCEFSMM
jgi:hypothetical protein